MASLKFIAVSGTTSVTQNMYIYEYGNDMLVVDCGVGFPEPEMYGVDLVIPDFSYLRKNQNKLRGILISHGHEDHIGGLPFLLKEISVPVYSTKLVAGFIEDKVADFKLKGIKVNVFDPEKDVLSFGVFKITPFRVSHSVPDGVGYAIDTPEGKVFHVPDYKFDWTPVDGRPFAIEKAAYLASEGTLALASDSLGSTSEGYTKSEREIEKKIEDIARKAKKKILFTTISSNISRIQQALNVALRMGRKVSFVGHSMDSKAEIAKNLGYLHYPKDLIIPVRQTKKISGDRILYIISGSYGQPGSALSRVSLEEHDHVSVEEGDVVIFSSDPAPPGSKDNVDSVVDRLIELGVDVHYYDTQEDLHVSGHGSQEDIKLLFALLKPKYFIPIGGTIRHMRAYKNLAIEMGAKKGNVFEPRPGDVIEFKNQGGRLSGKIPTRDVMVDGLGIGDVGNVVLRDRQILAQEGIAIVLLKFDRVSKRLIGGPEVISRGFVYEEHNGKILKKAEMDLAKEIGRRNYVDKYGARDIALDFLEKFFFKETGRRPMVLPLLIEV